MHTILKRISYTFLITCIFLLSGCIERLTIEDLPNEQSILDYVTELCSEPYSYIGNETDSDNQGITYFFLTDRGFEFYVHSSVSSGFLSDDTTLLQNTYENGVRSLYVDQVQDVLHNHSLTKEIEFHDSTYAFNLDIASYDDISEAVQILKELNIIWKQELTQYEQDFPLVTIDLQWNAAKTETLTTERTVPIETIQINGTFNTETMLTSLQESYTALYQSGDILFFSASYQAPSRILQELDPIVINDEECSYITISYNEDRDTYYVKFISNILHTGTEPWRTLEKTNGLQWASNVDYRDRSILHRHSLQYAQCAWTINDTTWELTFGINESFFGLIQNKYITLKKDGIETNEIEIVDFSADDITGTDYEVSLDDFCTLFDLLYEIDEVNGSISFQSQF